MALKSTLTNVYASMDSPSSPSSNHYYSAPSSPTQENSLPGYKSNVQKEESLNSNFEDFEFITSKSLRYEEMGFARSQSFANPLGYNKRNEKQNGQFQCRDSLPMMAFADELFSNGLVLPLKPPPRYLVSSTASSPRSPSSILKIHFSRQSKWDDEFDPFVVALEKVREEKRGRSAASEVPHRRTRSLSPLRSAVLKSPEDPCNELAKPKKSASMRWFHRGVKKEEPKKNIVNKSVSANHNDSIFGRRGRLVKAGFGREITDYEENRKKAKKGFLTKYASFGLEKNEGKITEKIAGLWKKSSLGNLSLKLKEKYGQNNSKKRM